MVLGFSASGFSGVSCIWSLELWLSGVFSPSNKLCNFTLSVLYNRTLSFDYKHSKPSTPQPLNPKPKSTKTPHLHPTTP